MFNAAPNSRSRVELARQVASISAEKQALEVYHRCPECGAERFTEHAVGDNPPD
jgi:hypothetical protein